jgi:hypothetical protein
VKAPLVAGAIAFGPPAAVAPPPSGGAVALGPRSEARPCPWAARREGVADKVVPVRTMSRSFGPSPASQLTAAPSSVRPATSTL